MNYSRAGFNVKIVSMLLFFAIILFSLNGCASFPDNRCIEKDGKYYGCIEGLFKYRWWHYYFRALSWADGGFWAKAEKDLLEAMDIAPRPDQMRTETLKRRYINYYPRRELGIVYYNWGIQTNDIQKVEMAIGYLTQSLTMIDTSKARSYISKARKFLIEAGRMRDLKRPNIKIIAPDNSTITKNKMIALKGIASDDTYLNNIVIENSNGGSPIEIEFDFQRTGDHEVHFSTPVKISSETNELSVIVEDVSGKRNEDSIDIFFDNQKPNFKIYEASECKVSKKRGCYLKAKIADKGGLQKIIANDKLISLFPSQKLKKIDEIIPLPPNKSSITLKIIDKAGNMTESEEILSDQFSNCVDGEEKNPPEIELYTENNNIIHYYPYRSIDGHVDDDICTREVKINGETISKSPHKRIRFNHQIPLALGKNKIHVLGEDTSGKQTPPMILNIEYKLPKVLQIDSRLKAKIVPFQKNIIPLERRNNEFNQYSKGLEEPFYNEIQKRFIIVENDQQADVTLRSSVTERQDSLEMSCEIIFGDIIDIQPSDKTQKLPTPNVYAEGDDINDLQALCAGVVQKIIDRLPIVSGEIVEIKNDNQFTIDIGTEMNIQPAMNLLVYRIEDIPEGGQIENRVAIAKIIDSEEGKSDAIVIPGTLKGVIRSGLSVITQ